MLFKRNIWFDIHSTSIHKNCAPFFMIPREYNFISRNSYLKKGASKNVGDGSESKHNQEKPEQIAQKASKRKLFSMMKTISYTWVFMSSRVKTRNFTKFFCETATKPILEISTAKFLFRIIGIQIIKKFFSCGWTTFGFMRTFHPFWRTILAHRWDHLKKNPQFFIQLRLFICRYNYF